MLEMSQPLGCTTVWMQHVFVMSLVSKQTWNDFSDVCLICSVVILSFTLFHKWRLVPSGFFPTQSSIPALCIRWVLMQTPEIVNFTVMATVGVAFLQQQLSDDTASRVRQFEQIVAARAAVLQFLGRPRFLDSLFQFWSGLTHSLILMEALLFPEQPVQTSSQLALPRENLPLSSIMDDRFQQWAPLIPLAIQSLAEYTDWFHEKYDENLHKEMAALLDDAMLLFQSIYQILQLRPDATAAAHAAPDTGGPDTAPTVVIAPFALPDTVTPADPWTSTWRSTSDRVRTGDMPVEAAGYVFFANCHFGHVTDAGRLMFSNGNEMWKMWRKIVTMDVKPTEAVKTHRRSYVDLCHIGPFPFRWWCCLWPNMCWPTLHYPSC